jgi:hypothetical protein
MLTDVHVRSLPGLLQLSGCKHICQEEGRAPRHGVRLVVEGILVRIMTTLRRDHYLSLAILLAIFVGLAVLGRVVSDGPSENVHRMGDMAKEGGSPTLRKRFEPSEDDPSTSNDESNDQPLGYFGTVTLEVHSLSSGNSYPLDVDLFGLEVERIYFPKGGWVDFYTCELDEDLYGLCTDEEGREWKFSGEW